MQSFHQHILLLLLLHISYWVSGFANALSTTPAGNLPNKSKLSAALSSPSGKLTLSPEILIPEPKDATSILLLTNAVQTLSERIRLCNANVAFIRGSIIALQTFTNEQATAEGCFPGPVPTVYCYGNDNLENVNFSDIASAGADGILINVCTNENVTKSINENVSKSEAWVSLWHAALCAGLQPIPEIQIGENASLTEGDIATLINSLTERVGTEPVAVILTTCLSTIENDNEKPVKLPKIPKTLAKRIPILGSIRATASDNRIYDETVQYKDAGYTGTFLRWDCVPGYQLQPNLELVGKFWFACISDLKSTRSKSFSFRSKNMLEVSAATKWGNYQKNVIESGALGDPGETASLNEAGGDYQGFA
jgi:hypothetical protein